MSKWLKVLSISSVIALLLAVVVGVALAQGPDTEGNPPTGTDDDGGQYAYGDCDCEGDGHMHGLRDGRGPHSEECDCEGDGHMHGLRDGRGPHSEECDCEGDGHKYGLGRQGLHSENCPHEPGEECPYCDHSQRRGGGRGMMMRRNRQ